jgi:hypothetical protein
LKWKLVEDRNFTKTYENSKGDIRVVYPKAPRWARKAAMKIWRDAEKNGFPTQKGTRDIVKGLWAKFIADAAKSR